MGFKLACGGIAERSNLDLKLNKGKAEGCGGGQWGCGGGELGSWFEPVSMAKSCKGYCRRWNIHELLWDLKQRVCWSSFVVEVCSFDPQLQEWSRLSFLSVANNSWAIKSFHSTYFDRNPGTICFSAIFPRVASTWEWTIRTECNLQPPFRFPVEILDAATTSSGHFNRILRNVQGTKTLVPKNIACQQRQA
nr:hypothetical protein Iba_chr05eCG6070 [Ipomoea batatas]